MVSEIASVILVFVIRWLLIMNIYGCLLVSASQLVAYYQQTFCYHLEITALPHTSTTFSILKWPCFLSLALYNPSVILIVLFDYCKITLC